jgi:Rieske Fe-S protein
MRTRREFLSDIGKVAGGAALGYVALPMLESCLPTSAPLVPAPTSIPVNPDGTITVDVSTLTQANPSLVVAGFIATDGFGVIVTLTPDGKYHAFSMRCTHLSCPVNSTLSQGKIYCACHGSDFNLDGTVDKPPATVPLTSYLIEPPATGPILKVKVQ